MPQSSRPSGQSGFSLIELIVAMAVTMLVTGAVYGLMAGGNNAFRREPELTERQQNARVAVEMIQKDIAAAGVNMGPFFQTFTPGLNGQGIVNGPSGQVADDFQIFTNDGTCPDAPAKPAPGCKGQGCPTNGVNFNARGPIPGCYKEESLVLVVYNNGGAKWGLLHEIHSIDKANFPGGQNKKIPTQIQGPADLGNWFPGDGTVAVSLAALNIIRYEIAYDPPGVLPPTGVPSLYRSPTGGSDIDGNFWPLNDPANIAKGGWQLLARGIEDLQVQYRNGNGAWADDPGLITCAGDCKTPSEADYNRGVREVRVTMSVRAEGQNLQGQTTSAASGRANAVRGSVTTVSSVKSLQGYLSAAGPTATCLTCPVWR